MDSEQIRNLIVDTLNKYAIDIASDSANKLLFKMYVRTINDINNSKFEDIFDDEWNKYVEKYSANTDDDSDISKMSSKPDCPPSCEGNDGCGQESKTLSFEEAHKGVIRDDAMQSAKELCENRKTILKPSLSRDSLNQHFDTETFVQEFVKVKNMLRSIKFEKLGNKQYVNNIITALNAYRRLLQ